MGTVTVTDTIELVFDDGTPVRAASAIARLADGWFVAQDDVTLGAWWRGSSITPVRLFAPVDGADRFSEAAGTKHLKPDLEAACPVPLDDGEVVLLLGSGSLPARMRAALVSADGGECSVVTGSLDALYERLSRAFGIAADDVNMEGACVVGQALRWFLRGNGAKGVASGAVDVDLGALIEAVRGRGDPGAIGLGNVDRYDLGKAKGVPLAVTDAAALPDGRIVVSAAAEDAPDAVADGPIVGAALAVLDGADVVAVMPLRSAPDGSAWKVEGIALRDVTDDGFTALAVVDQDDPDRPAIALNLEVRLT